MVLLIFFSTAHTTQFTKPGYHYLKHGSGSGRLDSGGSYVTFIDPVTKDFTLVIETMVMFKVYYSCQCGCFHLPFPVVSQSFSVYQTISAQVRSKRPRCSFCFWRELGECASACGRGAVTYASLSTGEGHNAKLLEIVPRV